MKKSLSTRLMYSYMGLIVVIIVGISIGLSYLITDYFFRAKEAELNDKGSQVAMMVRYFNAMDMDKTNLRQYLTSMDQLIGARIWLFNTQYELIGASESSSEDGEAASPSNLEREAKRREKWQKSITAIDQQLRDGGPLSDQVKDIITQVYHGDRVNARIFHPYYK